MMLYFFFFQAEDGIRDADVTGVQTCALPISLGHGADQDLEQLRVDRIGGAIERGVHGMVSGGRCLTYSRSRCRDRKSTRLNSSHVRISYAVFCLKKKNINVKHSYRDTFTIVR